MPFAPHLRISALGRLGNLSGERFSFGLNMHAPKDDRVVGLEANQAVWDDIAEDVRRYFATPACLISALAVLEEVKIASIGADGRYTADPIIVDVKDTKGGGGEGQGLIVPQSAMAVSLGTGRRGSTGRGRFYLPMPVATVSGQDLLIHPLDAAAIRDRTVTLVNDLNNQPGVDVLGLQVCVSSSKGYNSTVTTVRVGRVVDTVRSRRRSLQESYTVPAAVQPA